MGSEVGLGCNPGQHAGYVDHWVQILTDTPTEILYAAAEAEKISEYVLELEQKREISQTQDAAGVKEQIPHAERTYLAVPYEERDQAKAMGCGEKGVVCGTRRRAREDRKVGATARGRSDGGIREQNLLRCCARSDGSSKASTPSWTGKGTVWRQKKINVEKQRSFTAPTGRRGQRVRGKQPYRRNKATESA